MKISTNYKYSYGQVKYSGQQAKKYIPSDEFLATLGQISKEDKIPRCLSLNC
jgi:hypothetical protein